MACHERQEYHKPKLPLYKGFEVVLHYDKASSIARVSISAVRQIVYKNGRLQKTKRI